MIGGGLGPYAPGEWSDDTQLALCIAEVTASGADLTTDDELRLVAERFVGWQETGATDIGNQTRTVLGKARGQADVLAAMRAASAAEARRDRAGNGALMRTGIVGLVALDDPIKTADAAARVAGLTHAHQLCVESSILWSEAIRVAVVDERLDLHSGLRLLPKERYQEWAKWIAAAEPHVGRPASPEAFERNGFTVTALQAAWWAIKATERVKGPDHVEAALQAAIGLGHDTDTVAAIAGALLGARYGVSGLPSDLARRVHGWPGLRGHDLVRLALATADVDRDGPWLTGRSMLCGAGRPLAVPHPDDPDVLLGTEADLCRARELGITAVVSLSRVGAPEIEVAAVAPGNHATVWLVDSEESVDNAHLEWTLTDAARTVAALRDAGERVLVHCVHAQHRTPSVAMAYSQLRGHEDGAADRITRALGRPIDGRLWRTAVSPEAAAAEARLELLEELWLDCLREQRYPGTGEWHRASAVREPKASRDELPALIGPDKAARLIAAEDVISALDLLLGADLHDYRRDQAQVSARLHTWASLALQERDLEGRTMDMNVQTFVCSRIRMQLLRLRGTGDSLTVEMGDMYYQLASYDANQLLVEVSANEFLPHGSGLDGVDQKNLVSFGFTPPERDWPNWHIKLEDPTPQEISTTAVKLTAAIIAVYNVPPEAAVNGLLREFMRSHPDYRIDPEWVKALVDIRSYD